MKGKLETVMNDTELTWAAKGLMCILLNKSKNGEYGIFKLDEITPFTKETKEELEQTIDELTEKGYMSLFPETNGDGSFKEWNYIFFHEPKENPLLPERN